MSRAIIHAERRFAGETLRLPLPVEPLSSPSAEQALVIRLYDETIAAHAAALADLAEISRRIRLFGETAEIAGQALAESIRGQGAIEHDGRIYRATPAGDITVEDLRDAQADRHAHHA